MITPTLTEQAVPDLIGLPLEKARKLLALQGFAIGEVRFEDNAALLEENTVLSQRPEAGSPAPKNGQVNLILFRKSYLNYLPGVMQKEDERTGGLLKNYLWIVQHLMAKFQNVISGLPACFDPHTAPVDFLPWLASWMDLELEEDWSEEQRRIFLSQAAELYKWRGTKQGMKRCIHILSGEEVDIAEHYVPFKNMTIGENIMLGIKTLLHDQTHLEHWFTVRMPKRREAYAPAVIMKIHRIIAFEKPAHTQYFLDFDEPKRQYQEMVAWVLGQTGLSAGWVS